MSSGALVGVEWLLERVGGEGVVVLDASVGAHRRKGPWIPGALVFDIDGEMSDGGSAVPHTMLGEEQFGERVRELGIRAGDQVVVYDAAGIYSSARAWWMLRAAGFERVAVLDGGLPAWVAAGGPTSAEPGEVPEREGDFAARLAPGAFLGLEDVREALDGASGVRVLDARSRGRFAGTEPEPRAGLRGGHMPGAVNLPFGELQDGEGRMLPAAALRERFDALAPGDGRLVVSCGSGVTACVLALGAELAGHGERVSVYDGSWSEWGLEGTGTPVVTGKV
ncbi:sulfurtransferase [Streptomyces spiroverticillatus]|uniref:Sulfurtransferase n=1 Tax=Streptomyces finlayi TaxID=67296 RepID=A0A919C8T5_9ACTN|nr:sulfurtransferase [Streptomyces finlayi]GGZ98045.1 sulfurtransferase [Streptomyces spiroverticillatus]GHC83010.1 sulfurtransferase [Streptomyces finlayi]